jgi:hypothetical protein
MKLMGFSLNSYLLILKKLKKDRARKLGTKISSSTVERQDWYKSPNLCVFLFNFHSVLMFSDCIVQVYVGKQKKEQAT